MDTTKYCLLLNAINKIQAAGLEPGRWPDALAAVATCVDSNHACLYGVDLDRGAMHAFRSHNIEDSDSTDYSAYYHEVDSWLNGISPSWDPLKPLQGRRIISDAKMRRSEHDDDFLAPQVIRFLHTDFPFRMAHWMDIMSVFHGIKQDDFDEQAMEVYIVLLEHVAQALATQRTIGRLRHRSKGLATALENVSRAVLLLAKDGQILYANPTAEAVLADSDGLEVQGGSLSTSTPEGRGVVNKLLKALFDDAYRRPEASRRVTRIPRPSGRGSYILRASRIAQLDDVVALDDLSDIPCFMVMISDPEHRSGTVDSRELRTVYGLTPAEASLTAALVQGETLAQIAAGRQIAVDTARKRLKSIFEKTKTHRQSELIQRVLLDLGAI